MVHIGSGPIGRRSPGSGRRGRTACLAARLRGGRPAEFRRQSRRNVRPEAAYTHLTSYCGAPYPVECGYVKALSRPGSSEKNTKITPGNREL